MKRLITVLVFCVLFFAAKASPDSLGYSYYPSEIKHSALERKYDISKWFVYCIMCDQKIKFNEKSGIKENITFGMLPLTFDHIEIRNDTTEIDFYFCYNNKRINASVMDNFPTYGAVFVGQSEIIKMYSLYSDMRYYWVQCGDPAIDCPYREVNPLQPEVIKYIKQNKEKIDPWFRKEAQKRGVIK